MKLRDRSENCFVRWIYGLSVTNSDKHLESVLDSVVCVHKGTHCHEPRTGCDDYRQLNQSNPKSDQRWDDMENVHEKNAVIVASNLTVICLKTVWTHTTSLFFSCRPHFFYWYAFIFAFQASNILLFLYTTLKRCAGTEGTKWWSISVGSQPCVYAKKLPAEIAKSVYMGLRQRNQQMTKNSRKLSFRFSVSVFWSLPRTTRAMCLGRDA